MTRWDQIKEGVTDALIEEIKPFGSPVSCKICAYSKIGICPDKPTEEDCKDGIREYLNQEVEG